MGSVAKSPDERSGEWIARAMAMANINQAELAEASGISRATICKDLNSKRGIRVATLIRLIESCGLECELVIRPKNGK